MLINLVQRLPFGPTSSRSTLLLFVSPLPAAVLLPQISLLYLDKRLCAFWTSQRTFFVIRSSLSWLNERRRSCYVLPGIGEPPSRGKNQGIQHDRVEELVEFKLIWKLLCIFAVLCLLSFLTALDGTVITTSLPTITGQMKTHNDQLYIWIARCFILSSTAPQPLYGQLTNIFGRRNPFLIAIAVFVLGSGIAGAASDTAMLVTGRTVQGLGAAGLYVLSDIIICDLVRPRNRGPYLSAVLSTAGIGSTIGPVIGGAIAEHNWR